MRKYLLLLVTVFIVLGSCKRSDTVPPPPVVDDWPTDTVRIVKNNLSFPWEILWGKDNYIWMTERGGKISKIDPKTGTVAFSSTITEVVSNGEGGLLGMVQHPDFLTNGQFYVVYNYNNGTNYREKMVQLKYTNNNIQVVSTIIENVPASGIHNGSRLWITNEAVPKLFMTTGDASVQNNAQNTTSLSGKTLRFNLDGSIPADNPFAGSPVWSFGHRNPQGMVEVNGNIYTSEHGPSIEDEVNIIEKGRNFGWPNVNGPCDDPGEITFCTANNVKPPIWSSGGSTIAVSGLDYYSNSRIAVWQNSLLMATLKDASLRILTLSTDSRSIVNQQTFFKNRFGRIRDICVSPAGRVYLCTSNGNNVDVIVEISKP